MAKKKSNPPGRNRNADKGGTLAATPVWEDESPCRWPESLAPWRTALFMAIASGALAALAYGAAALGGFCGMRLHIQ